jgi:hypothetical protein
MKLSELKALVDKYHERSQQRNEDPEVVVNTINVGVPYNYKAKVAGAVVGGDWTKGLFMIATEETLAKVDFNGSKASAKDLAQARLDYLKDAYAKCGQRYIAKVREEEWKDGYIEGLRSFNKMVDGDES